jgi:hypothetical protein
VSWHRPVREGLGFSRGTGVRYFELLSGVAEALDALAARMGSPVLGLPALLGRPGTAPAQLVDAYLWITVTRGHDLAEAASTPTAPRTRV